MTTKKRRAKSGETRVLNYDVIAYAPENWLYPNRITVRDKETGRVEEARGYVISWAVARAVSRLITTLGQPAATTTVTVAHAEAPFTLTNETNV